MNNGDPQPKKIGLYDVDPVGIAVATAIGVLNLRDKNNAQMREIAERDEKLAAYEKLHGKLYWSSLHGEWYQITNPPPVQGS